MFDGSYSTDKCMARFKGHWYKCLRDDSVGDKPGRTSFKVLAGIFFVFLVFGIFVAIKLYRSANVKHRALYLFYFLGLLTLASKFKP